jgi:hypothetical protein
MVHKFLDQEEFLVMGLIVQQKCQSQFKKKWKSVRLGQETLTIHTEQNRTELC